MKDVAKLLRASSRKTITLDELRDIFKNHSYEETVTAVNELCSQNVLSPVKASKGNGMNPPLYMKYRIIPQTTDNAELLKEIRSLHHLINTGPFLKSPEKYGKKRDIFLQLSEYLKSNFNEFEEPMSENERAYSIWHDEKLLDNSEMITALKECSIFDVLNTYPTPEPFFDHRTSSPPDNVLIIENKDTWFSARKLMIEKKSGIRLFDILFDCVLYGEGKKSAQSKNSISEYLSLDSFCGDVYYWGDMDYEGINIFLMTQKVNEALNIKLFVPAYEMMLREFEKIYNRNDDVFRCRKNQKKPHDMGGFLLYFEPETQEKITGILENGAYIPQEILNYQILRRAVS